MTRNGHFRDSNVFPDWNARWSKEFVYWGWGTSREASMPAFLFRLVWATSAVVATLVASHGAVAQNSQVERGKYIVTLSGCNDCHTPGYFFGKPDMARYLGGSEVGFEIPGQGVFYGSNLTPDNETGLGKWSAQEIVTAITTGQRPDGRALAPIMPWHAYAHLTPEDSAAIAAFLKNLQPVNNRTPGPFGPAEKPTSFVLKIVPPESATAGGAAPK
jgi:mono/diheme cytochrome c family protein